MALATGQRVTLLKIDEHLAMTHRYEFEVRAVLEPQPVGYQRAKSRVAVVRPRGKRKEFYLDLAADDVLLDGWDQPFRADTEAGGIIAGNACYNLVGDPAVIRACIEQHAAVPVSDGAKAKVIVSRAARTTCSDDGLELLYPEIATQHAVIDRMKARRPGGHAAERTARDEHFQPPCDDYRDLAS